MSSYVDDNLLPSETVIYRAHPSLWTLLSIILAGLALVLLPAAGYVLYREKATEFAPALLFVAGVGLVFFVWARIVYRSTEFAVTDRRIIAKTGFISRNTVEMFLDKVESLNVDQTIAGRIFNFGTVTIRGTGSTEEPIGNISGPLALRKQFMAAADSYRRGFKA